MFRKSIAVLALAVSGGVLAEEIPDTCTVYYELSLEIMTARQLGMALPRLLEIVGDNPAVRSTAQRAYRRPLFTVEDIRERAIQEFANSEYLACLDNQ